MDAIAFIRHEHAQIRKKLASIKSSLKKDKVVKPSFDKLAAFLVRHETMEQKLWYPALRKDAELKKIITHLVSEEKTAGKAIKKIKTIKNNEVWIDHVLQLAKDVSKHANDEEKKLFPKVRKKVDKDKLEIIGQRLYKFKVTRKKGKTP